MIGGTVVTLLRGNEFSRWGRELGHAIVRCSARVFLSFDRQLRIIPSPFFRVLRLLRARLVSVTPFRRDRSCREPEISVDARTRAGRSTTRCKNVKVRPVLPNLFHRCQQFRRTEISKCSLNLQTIGQLGISGRILSFMRFEVVTSHEHCVDSSAGEGRSAWNNS